MMQTSSPSTQPFPRPAKHLGSSYARSLISNCTSSPIRQSVSTPLGECRARSPASINRVNGEKDPSNEGNQSGTNAGASPNVRTRSQPFSYINPSSEMAPQHVLPVQPSAQDTFSAQAGMHDHLPYGQFTGTQFVPGIKPISPPFFNDCSQATQRSAKEKILDYRDRVKASNFKHGTTSKPLEVIFMMKRELASSMITQMLAPGTTYDSHSLFQQQLIDRWFMSEDSIYGVPQDIRIHEFNSRMSKISMNAQNPSWFDRLRAFFESVDKCIVQCRVQVNDKSLIIKMMKGVNPPRLRKRIAGLLSSGDPAQQSCRTNVSLWKDLLRQETQIEHSAQLTLALANSPYSEDNRQRTRRS